MKIHRFDLEPVYHKAIAYYRSKLEAVVFMWVPAHVGIACNAYADAVATAHLGDNDSEDASKVVRDAVRTRPCMYMVRREAAENAEKREIVDRRTYGHMCCLLYTSPSPRDKRQSRMPSSA